MRENFNSLCLAICASCCILMLCLTVALGTIFLHYREWHKFKINNLQAEHNRTINRFVTDRSAVPLRFQVISAETFIEWGEKWKKKYGTY